MKIKEITFRMRSGNGSRCLDTARARVYIHIDGESILQNLQDRRIRPYNVYKKEVLPLLAAQLGFDVSTLDLRWSQRAGCSCPCSPGFVDHSHRLARDIHVTITDDDSYVTPKISGKIPDRAAY